MRLLVGVLLLLTVPCAVLAEEEARVGSLGRLERIRFEGVTAWPVETIRGGLGGIAGFWVAGHPEEPRRAYLETIRDLIERGYRHGGFPDVAVRVVEDRGDVVVRVKEGPRFRAGSVLVEAPEGVDRSAVAEFLTTPRDERKPDRVAWKADGPAPFDGETRTVLEGGVASALANLGFFQARSRIALEPGQDGTARLRVVVEDAGPVSVLRRIDVDGAPREAVVALLGLEVGRPVHGAAIRRAERRLFESGRFLRSSVTLDPVEQDEVGVVATVRLLPSDEAPPLGEPLGDLEKALLRTRTFLLDLAVGRTDYVVVGEARAGPCRIDFALDPREGVLVRASGVLGDRPEEWVAAQWGPRRIALAASARRRAAVFEGRETGAILKAELVADPDGQTNFTTHFSAGLTAFPTGRWLDFRIDPVACIAVARRLREATKVESSDGVLVCRGDGILVRLDEVTGRPLEISFEDPWIRVRTVPGAEASGRLEVPDGFTDRASATQPLWSGLRFLLEETAHHLAHAPEAWADLRSTGRRMEGIVALLGGGFEELAKRASEIPAAGSTGPFRIPVSPTSGEKNDWILTTFAPTITRLFGSTGWPGLVAREILTVATGRQQHSGTVLGRLYESPGTGPVGYVALATLASLVDERMAGAFAAEGLKRLDEKSFVDEGIAIVFGPDDLGALLRRTIASVREMPEEKLAPILENLETEGLGPLAPAVRAVREEGAVRERVAAALGTLWREGLKESLEAELRALLDD